LIKKLKTDDINNIVTIEISRSDLERIIDSVSNMVAKLQRKLLENIPSNESDRKNLDDYKALEEDLRKIRALG
jgi:Na+/phosphate symporter